MKAKSFISSPTRPPHRWPAATIAVFSLQCFVLACGAPPASGIGGELQPLSRSPEANPEATSNGVADASTPTAESLRATLLAGASDPSLLAPLVDWDRGLGFAILTQHDGWLMCNEASLPLDEEMARDVGSLFPMGPTDSFECNGDLSECVNSPGGDGSPEPWADMAVRFMFHRANGSLYLHQIYVAPHDDGEGGAPMWDGLAPPPADGCVLRRAIAAAEHEPAGFLELEAGPRLRLSSRCGGDAARRFATIRAALRGPANCADGICRFDLGEEILDLHLRGDPPRIWAVAALTSSDGYSLDNAAEYAEFIESPPALECPR